VPDYASVLFKVVVILGVINRVPAAIPEHNVLCYSAVAYILTPSVNLSFGPKSGFKNKCRPWAGFRLVISGSDLVKASTWGPFTTLCLYVRRGQQGETERTHPPPTNSEYRVKSFCEVGYANFMPNVFGAGKRISTEIWVRWGCMHDAQQHWKDLWHFQKREKSIYRLCNVEQVEQGIKLRRNPHFL